ncbi:hypothetical protein ACFL0X_02100 [Nanoarchaeota archaeon]
MYVGIINKEPELEKVILDLDFDLGTPLGEECPLWKRLARYDQYLAVSMAAGHALENIRIHGSGNFSIKAGFGNDRKFILRIEDPQGGFDPETITTPKRWGNGLLAYQDSRGTIGHSPDGKITYLTNKTF